SPRDAAAAVRRVELSPSRVVARSDRLDIEVRSAEAIAGRPNAYIIYTDDGTYAEGGVYWTRGTERSVVYIAPASASTGVLILHVGPSKNTVGGALGARGRNEQLAPGETRRIELPLAESSRVIPLSIEASAPFRPADSEPGSTDARLLGCQVRVQ